MNKDLMMKIGYSILGGAVLAIIGSLMGWFSFESEVVSSLAEDEFNSRQTAVIVVAILVVIAVKVAAMRGMRALTILATVLALYATLVVFNQLPSQEEKDLLDVTIDLGYWLSLIGTVLMSAGSIFLAIKGVGEGMDKTAIDWKDKLKMGDKNSDKSEDS